MPTPRKLAKPQPMDGDLTMRQLVAARLQGKIAGTEVRWKFGHASFQTAQEKVFCFINREGHLAVKLPPARLTELVESGLAQPLRMGERTMREWVVVPDPDAPSSLQILREAKAYVESLPVKPARAKSTRLR